jgi:hypothetical protein
VTDLFSHGSGDQAPKNPDLDQAVFPLEVLEEKFSLPSLGFSDCLHSPDCGCVTPFFDLLSHLFSGHLPPSRNTLVITGGHLDNQENPPHC